MVCGLWVGLLHHCVNGNHCHQTLKAGQELGSGRCKLGIRREGKAWQTLRLVPLLRCALSPAPSPARDRGRRSAGLTFPPSLSAATVIIHFCTSASCNPPPPRKSARKAAEPQTHNQPAALLQRRRLRTWLCGRKLSFSLSTIINLCRSSGTPGETDFPAGSRMVWTKSLSSVLQPRQTYVSSLLRLRSQIFSSHQAGLSRAVPTFLPASRRQLRGLLNHTNKAVASRCPLSQLLPLHLTPADSNSKSLPSDRQPHIGFFIPGPPSYVARTRYTFLESSSECYR